jgi:hypothetical protein
MSSSNSWEIQPRFVAELSGSGEVPPVPTSGTGIAEFRLLSARRLSYRLSVRDLRDITEAHIHLGRRNENGPIVAWLFGPSRPVSVTGVLASGRITRRDLVGPLRGRSIATLVRLMRQGRTYTNVHTVRHPDGEIRGQIRPAGRTAVPVPGWGWWRDWSQTGM